MKRIEKKNDRKQNENFGWKSIGSYQIVSFHITNRLVHLCVIDRKIASDKKSDFLENVWCETKRQKQNWQTA